MNRYSSSVHKSDWECSSKSVRGSFFVNPLYIKNLTNLTNLTTLQTLQPYRFLCRVPKGPHAYLCTLHKGRLPAQCGLHEICSFSSLLRAFQSNWEAQFWKRNPACLHGSRPVRNDGLEPCEPSKIKRTHRSRSFWLPRRRSAVFSHLLQDVDGIPEMLHRGSDGLHGIVKLQDGSHRLACQDSGAFKVPQRQVAVLQARQFTVKLAS